MSEQFKSVQAALAEKDLIGFKRRKVGGTPVLERASSAKGVKTSPTKSPAKCAAQGTLALRTE